ncbi:hypothetical protein BH11PAT4_BH11PAT4_7640 [soil metagenome]
MKLREILIFSLLFLVANGYAVYVVVSTLTDTKVSAQSVVEHVLPSSKPEAATAECQAGSPIAGLDTATEPHLKKLSEYQVACNSLVTNELMIFTDMPKDGKDAKIRAQKIAESLTAFKKAGVKPLVIVEPVSDWGLIDFTEFGTGFYDEWITVYFQELKDMGFTDAEMGTWVPFPEANLPYWNNTNATPADFSGVVNRYLRIYKRFFPTAEASILLNSATYDSNDFEWSSGEYISLREYVKGIDKGIVQSFGLQGFSWMPNALQQGPGVFSASEYLNRNLAAEAADFLGVKKIWYNTGSFSAKYTLDTERKVTLSPGKRSDVLISILTEAKELKEKGYTVSINLFA